MKIDALNYHEASVALEKLLPHHVYPRAAGEPVGLRTEIAAWCKEHFGPSAVTAIRQEPRRDFTVYDLDSERSWGVMGFVFCFRDADHAFHFKMRWG